MQSLYALWLVVSEVSGHDSGLERTCELSLSPKAFAKSILHMSTRVAFQKKDYDGVSSVRPAFRARSASETGDREAVAKPGSI
jgi:hypothetical protein